MTHEEHKRRHQRLHQGLHELVNDFIGQTGLIPSETPIGVLVRWSQRQAENPTRNEFVPEEEAHLPVIEVQRG